LKAENALLDQQGNIRVVGFAFSESFSRSDPFLETTCGSPAYVSPEIIREEPYTAAADVWASGVLLYVMLCGSLLFNGGKLSVMQQAILSSNPFLPNHISPELRELIGRLLMKDPNARITVRQILEHWWLTELGQMNQDALASMRVQEASELDEMVLAEMRTLGYDISGLHQDLKNYMLNEKTAAYKTPQRKRSMGEIHALEIRRSETIPTSVERLPTLEPEVPGRARKTTDPAGNAADGVPEFAQETTGLEKNNNKGNRCTT
jgi:serine/threonine protein kinase